MLFALTPRSRTPATNAAGAIHFVLTLLNKSEARIGGMCRGA